MTAADDRRPMTASAPGKVLWAGEYAVLEGATAVVAAVDRRATARVADRPQRLSPFLEAARREVELDFGGPSDQAARAARIVVDSRPLEERGKKLGLGSSAAATVAAVAAALGPAAWIQADGLPRIDRARIHALAHRAHAAAQEPRGARGSGADIAASVHGGMLLVTRAPAADDRTPLVVAHTRPPVGAVPVLVWTGIPAETPPLVARVRALRDANPAEHAARIDQLARAAEALRHALEAGDPAAAIAAIDQGSHALHALGEAAGAPLVPAATAPVRDLARRHGGAAKPTGAGGGDVLLALVPEAAVPAFTDEARHAGMVLLTADVSSEGVSLADPGRPS